MKEPKHYLKISCKEKDIPNQKEKKNKLHRGKQGKIL